MSFNHLDFRPERATTGEIHDAYRDMQRIADGLSIENARLYQRQHLLEEWIAGQVKAALDGMNRRCLLGECQPRYEPQRSRFVHVEPCRMAAAEQLLRERIDPYASELLRPA